jgi:hypothetical protein
MKRYFTGLLLLVSLVGCQHTPPSAQGNCHVESGWLDSSNGCSERAGYPDCYRVCADGTRERIGGPPQAASPPQHAP